MREKHITREIDVWGQRLVYGKYTLYIVRVLGVREIAGYLESEGRDVCMPERQSDRDLYWGLDFTRERGVNVLVCWCLGEGTTSLCVWVWWGARGVASDKE